MKRFCLAIAILFGFANQALAHQPEMKIAHAGWSQNEIHFARSSMNDPSPIPVESKSKFIILADRDDDDDDGGHHHKGKGKKKHWKKHHDGDDDDDGYRGKKRKKNKKNKHKHKKHWKKEHRHYDYHDAKWKPYHNRRLPAWARDCGLPPGLAKQNKIPPGWEKKCRKGYKYYEREDEFRRDVEIEYSKTHGRRPGDSGKIDTNAPSYQVIYNMDDSDCKVKALKQAGSVGEGVAKGAVYGGILGAATGVLIEAVQEDGNQEHGAIYGATGGAAGGAVLGGILASNEFKEQYRECMRRRGHKVR
ncbi:MAG: hypothetical protein G3M70_00230 [Candidatus Nitronauta litoralis]|uniref:Glycine zipper domain-containing protein n=1 Tax=Candidatus Nitronauta litoralis TaxID=2705533 RepID=A0A7T0BT00_9BACT|nr:MAG: hypothetical protein G3M70_00230 [Candidatus Nitronauta litoralis]